MIILESTTADLDRLLGDGIGRRRFGTVICRSGSSHFQAIGDVKVYIQRNELVIDVEGDMKISPSLAGIKGVTWKDPTLRIDQGPGRVILITWA